MSLDENRRITDHPTAANIAIVLAGGSGTRFGSETNKVLVPIGGRPVLAWSLDTFERCNRVDAIVIVIRSGDDEVVESIMTDAAMTKIAAVVPGGSTRQQSEWAGIQAAAGLGFEAPVTVAIHDAARPFVTLDLLDRLLEPLPGDVIGTIPALPFAGALIDLEGRVVDGADLVRVQTPQVFRLDVLLDRYPRAEVDGFAGTDTAQTVEQYSLPTLRSGVDGADDHGAASIRWVVGDADNIKVTHPDDRDRAASLAEDFVAGAWTRRA